ncbi:MAG: bifunctional DNA-formamidopyrimidine glycosylase/DNA-(apurinic or apyrimidinic site) lyase [Chloroflexota bacterium]|nr:bifunctional DNA-formamidopyrimidine glycosylase/DNA-(apurinic or apyrimidinic site) lyase [Chloroflexota bacterium]
MPELPEVETICNKFRRGTDDTPSLIGKRVIAAELLWERTLAEPSPPEFKRRIIGQSITAIGRRGKYLLFHLNADTLVIHLRMSGDLWLETDAANIAPHHRLLLYLDDPAAASAQPHHRLAFNDTRKFGRVWLVNDHQAMLSHLGPEPLSDEFTPQLLYDRLQSRRRQLKPLILEQSFIAGVGNIYADEALHRARLHPKIHSHILSFAQAERLWESIRHVLREGIYREGASIDWVYRGGDFQNYFQVYQRTGEPCYRCNTPIERIKVGQRSTHFCPQCQPAPE